MLGRLLHRLPLRSEYALLTCAPDQPTTPRTCPHGRQSCRPQGHTADSGFRSEQFYMLIWRVSVQSQAHQNSRHTQEHGSRLGFLARFFGAAFACQDVVRPEKWFTRFSCLEPSPLAKCKGQPLWAALWATPRVEEVDAAQSSLESKPRRLRARSSSVFQCWCSCEVLEGGIGLDPC